MNINRDNYEAFFLDFAEGNLSAEQEEILNNFLKFNPDLDAELKEFDLLFLSPNDIRMPSKDALKKEILKSTDALTPQNFDIYSIAFLENDLTEYQRSIFETFIENDSTYRKSFQLMQKTYLKAGAIPFPQKARLKKRPRAVINLRLILPFAAAAAIALFILVRADYFTIKQEIAVVPERTTSAEITELEPVIKKPPVKEKAASIRIIRNSRTQVPVSNLKSAIPDLKSQIDVAEKKKIEIKRIAGLNPPQIHIPQLDVEEDRIVPEILPVPTINRSSLALADRLKYQLNKASELVNEDDVFIWNIASQGIEGINKLAGTDMSLMASQDQEGSVSGFKFKSRLLNVIAPISTDRY